MDVFMIVLTGVGMVAWLAAACAHGCKGDWRGCRESLAWVVIMTLVLGMHAGISECDKLLARVAVLEAQLAKQQPAAQNNATEQKKQKQSSRARSELPTERDSFTSYAQYLFYLPQSAIIRYIISSSKNMDKNMQIFDRRVEALEPHIVALLGAIDDVKGQFRAGLRMTPQAVTSLRRSVLITSAGASTRIEGAKLSDDEVRDIMQGLAASKFADRDSQEVQGYLETLQNVFDGYKKLPLREGVIQSLHKELLKYSRKDEAQRGKYKQKENMVGVLGPDGKVARIVFKTTPAYLTPNAMRELVDWTYDALEKNRFHPLLVIANFIVEFLKIHPFEDGNGRLSRVLTNLLLIRSGYQFVQYVSHEQLVEKRKDEYYIALRKSQETFGTAGDTIAPWLNFFLSIVQEQAKQAVKYLEEEKIEDVLSPKQYEVWKYISGIHEASPAAIAKETNIVMPTVRQALNRLIKLGRVKRIGRGRGTRYVKL